MIKIDISRGLKQFRRDFDSFAKKQLPLAVSRALTETARKAAAVEVDAMSNILDRPTPFTLRGPVVRAATTSNLVAVLDMRPIQAAYLAPEEFGEPQKTVKGTVLTPVDAALNAYGNIPRGALQRYKNRKDVFVGTLSMKDGRTVTGVWQRMPSNVPQRTRTGRTGRKPSRQANSERSERSLRLLFEFKQPVVPGLRLGWRERAIGTIRREIGPQLAKQMAIALKAAR